MSQPAPLAEVPAPSAPLAVKRGRGRPRGSRNKPKPAPLPMTTEQLQAAEREREALKLLLAARYAEALVTRTLAGVRAKRLKATIRSKLGRDGLATIEAEIVAPAIAREQAG